MKKPISVMDAARSTHVHPETIYRDLRLGLLKAERVDGRWVLEAAAVEKWVRTRGQEDWRRRIPRVKPGEEVAESA